MIIRRYYGDQEREGILPNVPVFDWNKMATMSNIPILKKKKKKKKKYFSLKIWCVEAEIPQAASVNALLLTTL